VIAHEFSHVLNGDMRLNLKLIGLLHGILLIAIIGRIILEGMRFVRVSGSRNKNSGGAILVILASGLALLIIGSVGVFFGKLIKAAVSRQREFLADASAVQFTRNPEGIGGGLMKIGGLVKGSRIANPRAEEASHMFFANGMRSSFASAFATHPPLDVRIRKILPSWDGAYPEVSLPPISSGWKDGEGEAAPEKGILAPGQAGGGAAAGLSAAVALGAIGQLEQEQIETGEQIHEELPVD
jgi:hypothetical protein